MEYDISTIDTGDIEFGGQNQIVNTQEQNREVNRGGLTDTESEDVLYNKEEKEEREDQKPAETDKEKEQTRQKEKVRGTRKSKAGVLD